MPEPRQTGCGTRNDLPHLEDKIADGHAEIHKWLDKRTYPDISKGNMQLNVSMMYNRDLYWMMEKATRPVRKR